MCERGADCMLRPDVGLERAEETCHPSAPAPNQGRQETSVTEHCPQASVSVTAVRTGCKHREGVLRTKGGLGEAMR